MSRDDAKPKWHDRCFSSRKRTTKGFRMPNNELPTIDPQQLSAVTGGAGGDVDQVTMMLQSLMSSIKELAAQRQNGGNDQLMQMLPMLMIMRNRQQAGAPPPEPAPQPPPGDGWIRVT
jgi:hypothetical protein